MARKQRRKILYIVVVVFLLFLSVFGGWSNSPAFAEASETESPVYSDVLDDLKSDEAFNPDEYPQKDEDNSLNVIQIAESADKELLIYVYQPSANVRELTATEIRISQSIGDNLSPKDFSLTLLNRNGVFAKYLVNDLTVKKEILRYYEIISIFRQWNGDIDGSTGDDNEINSVSYRVAKLYTVITLDDKVTYSCEEDKVITVTDKYVDYLRYYNGWSWSGFDYTHSHYVAFSADMDIDELYEADIYFVTRYAEGDYFNFNIEISDLDLEQKWEFSEPVENYAYIKEKDVLSNTSFGVFGNKVLRDRISTVSAFKENENLSAETIKNLEGKQWVLRFYESEYGVARKPGIAGEDYSYKTEVSSVSILRLYFKSKGQVYNLGVVDNKQMGDDKPGNTNEYAGFWEWLANLLGVDVKTVKIIFGLFIGLIVLAIAFPILAVIFPVFGQILKSILNGILAAFKVFFKGLWFIICLPFKGIAVLIRKIRGE